MATALLCLAIFGTIARSQSPRTTYDVDIELSSANVKTVSRQITTQTGLAFSYASSLASKDMGRIYVHLKNAETSKILAAVFDDKGISYRFVEGMVVLTESESATQEEKKPTTKIIHGIVTDESGNPVISGGVLIKGTTKGVITDSNGRYSVSANNGDVLVFTYLGYSDQEARVGNSNEINIQLSPDANILDDVIVIGYGTQSKRSLTSAISKVSGDAIYNAPVSNTGDALKGKVAGLRVSSNVSLAGASPRYLIRGGSSINMSNDPIVIVDGVTRSMNYLNPNDIESIEVLKDAASAAIYGARASNGVILVTTKKGNKYSSPEITFETQVGLENPSRKWDLMNSREFINFVRPALVIGYNGTAILNGANAAGTGNTNSNSTYTTQYLERGKNVPEGYDWMYDPIDSNKIIIFQNHNYQKDWFRENTLWNKDYIGVNGGNDKMRYAASIGYLHDDGILAMNAYNLFTFHGNTTFRVLKNLEASTTFDFGRSVQKSLTDNYFNAVGRGLMLAPTHRDYDDDGRYITGGTNSHQQTAAFYKDFYDRERANNTFTGNFNLKWYIVDGLTATAQYAVTDIHYRGSYYAYGERKNTPNYISTTRGTTETREETLTDSFNAYLTFDKMFGNHHVSGMGGTDLMYWRYWYLTANAIGSPSDKVPILDSGTTFSASNRDTKQALLSYFARLSYDFKNRYFASTSIRADGSSKFADGHKWGYFPSASAGWVVSEESFWNSLKHITNFAKIRVSYGLTGNNEIGLYDAYGAFSTAENYAGLPTTLPSTMQNNSLKWETTRQIDAGLEINFLKDRIRFTADYYNKKTQNMLFSVVLPDTGSLGSIKANVGSARFYGFELELQTINIRKKKFTWESDLTYSYNRNKVLSLPDEYEYVDINGKKQWRIGGYTLSESGYRFGGTAVGEPLGRIYGFKIDHIIESNAEADAAIFDSQSHGYRRDDGKSIAGRKDVGDYEWCNRKGSAKLPDGSEQINGEDIYYLGNVVPHSTGGINNTFRYRNWSLGIYLDYALGHSIYNYMKSRFFQNTLGNCNSNLDKMVYDCWSHPGDNAKYARFFPNDADFGNRNFSRISDFNVEKGNYLCIRDVSISYDLQAKWLKKAGLEKLTLGASGNTLYYFTAVSGSICPESGIGTGSSDSQYSVVQTGDSNGNFFPAVRKVLFNVKLTF